MPSTYLDTNVYPFGFMELDEDCSCILREAARGHGPAICQSDYLFEEVMHWLKRERDKNAAGRARAFMISFPHRTLIHHYEWGVIAERWKPFVSHDDDLPHVCSYLIGECEAFVTTNRRLTQSKLQGKVKFMTPKESVGLFLEKTQ